LQVVLAFYIEDGFYVEDGWVRLLVFFLCSQKTSLLLKMFQCIILKVLWLPCINNGQ